MDEDLKAKLESLSTALKNLSEFDGDASWYKDNSKGITELIKSAYELEDWYYVNKG